ncbi:hypothetical protein ACHMW6_30730 [Pseudoduganella sp. UC29_106]|uniref:hypothetical protein n=1 Tax=Pseudoduganella sp. UC29_106 TaxID=3374553 RepID=UPI0037573DE7
MNRLIVSTAIAAVALTLAACAGTEPKLGGGGTVATGAAGGAQAANANPQLEKCDKTLGTLGVVEDTAAPWYRPAVAIQAWIDCAGAAHDDPAVELLRHR